MRNNKILFMIFVCFLVCLSGCTYQNEIFVKEPSTESFEDILVAEFNKNQTSVSEIIPIHNEPFSLVCTYDTKDYPLDKWKVTSNKNIYMIVNTKNLPEGYKVNIEHVHADIVLKSYSDSIDGITQDSMDDYDHRTPSNGFPINDKVFYENVFAIEGYTDKFYELWGLSFGRNGGMYGAVSSSYERLTESNILNAGTYAEKLMVVYDLIISTPEFPEGYSKSIYSEVLIPLINSNSVYKIYECTKAFKVNLEGTDEQISIDVGSTWKFIDWDERKDIITLRRNDGFSIYISSNNLRDNFLLRFN